MAEPLDLSAVPRPRRPFFAKAVGRDFSARTVDGETIIDIFDEIGAFGVDVADVEAQLRGAGNVTVRITSAGGDVFAGLGIHALLANHPGRVRVEILGLAASAASLIAMAGETIAMAANSHLMIHRSWGLTVGNAGQHDEAAALLRRVDASMAGTYAERSGQSLAAVNAMLEAETWLTADEAVANGFADEVIEAPARPKAKFDLSVFANVPAGLVGPIERETPTIRDVEAALRDAGFSRSQSRAMASRVNGETDRREADELAALAAHIRAAANSLSQ